MLVPATSRKNRPLIIRDNLRCPYCGRVFEPSVVDNEEHVVGRRFVPKGTMENEFNLILRACKTCNEEKSQLEDDISVISMMLRGSGRDEHVESLLAQEVARRAPKSGSRRTGKAVANSNEQITLKGQSANATFTARMLAPPQLDEHRVYRLAQLHFDAFYFSCCVNQKNEIGGYIPYRFRHNVGCFSFDNWGNLAAKWFMETTVNWSTIFWANTAKGFFKLIIRASPCKTMWACALEWNQSIRVMRLLGQDRDSLEALVHTSPIPPGMCLEDDAGNLVKVIRGERLNQSEDVLFTVLDEVVLP